MKQSNLFLLLFTYILLGFTNCSKNKKATCTDGIKNQAEVLTDCGGPCSPCETCSDGILNQDETATDCGGVCSKCGTCSDGIQNQGEFGVDCGGPCVPCSEKNIYYSEFGTNGYNLLHDDTIKVVTAFPAGVTPDNVNVNYAIRSQVPEGLRLRVVFKKTSGTGTLWNSAITNWKTTYYNNNDPISFETIGKITADVSVGFRGHGTATLQIFEGNATIPTREKLYIW